MVAIVTPMQSGIGPDTPLDFDAMAELIEFHVENQTDALVAVGTTGESATLDEQEHCRVISFVVERGNDRVPVIAGTGANSTTEAIRLTDWAKRAGAHACLLVTPYYNKPTQEGLYQHHKAVAEAVAIPQILYNVPGRTACDLLPETVARLAQVDNIIGIKEATGDLERVDQLRASCGDDFILLSGDDATAMEFMLRGGSGVISVTANLVPMAMHRLCVAATEGKREQAEKINQDLEALHRSLFLESNPIPVKWALNRMGLIRPGLRLPLTWLSEPFHDPLLRALAQAGIPH